MKIVENNVKCGEIITFDHKLSDLIQSQSLLQNLCS